MGKNTDKMYITHSEHAAGSHSAAGFGKRAETGHQAMMRLPFDSCALSLQPFRNPVAVIADTAPGDQLRADVFDLLNIVPYVRKFKTNPVTGKPLETSALLKLNFFKNSEGNYHDPITFKVFSPHVHIVFLKNTGNVFDMASLQLLAIKAKTWRDLMTDEPFAREDIITIQDPANLASRDLREYDYIKRDKKVGDDDVANDPLKGINVDAAGGAGKVLKMLADKTREENTARAVPAPKKTEPEDKEKEGVIATRKVEQLAYNATNFTTGAAAASFTSTTLMPQVVNDRLMLDEEEIMFDELKKPTKEKERLKSKAYATILTNYGGLNVELHGDRAPKTVYNFVQLAKAGKYDNVVFHRLIPGFMVQGGDPTGTGRGGQSFWGEPFRDEWAEKGAYKHDARGVLSMANSGPRTNGSQFFITFRETAHLNGKHTVFGKLVGGEDTLNRIERIAVRPGSDKPIKDVVITGVQILQDPFEDYKVRLAARLSKLDQSEEAQRKRAAAAAEREKDRTTWLGTDLGEKGESSAVREERKRKADDAGVGKYLGAGASKKKPPTSAPASGASTPTPAAPQQFGIDKKKRKAGGGFGDFSAW